MPATQTRPENYTYQRYRETPLEGSFAILDGVLHPMPAPTLRHQRILRHLIDRLSQFEQQGRLGQALFAPLDIVIRREPLRTRQPDALFISTGRLEDVDIDAPLEVAPELIVEVLSPSENARSIREKLDDFASVGAVEAWLVSPEAETVQVLRLSPEGVETAGVYASGQSFASLTFEGLTVAVADLFAS